MNRRNFLKTSLLAIVAAYAPISLPGEKKLTMKVVREAMARVIQRDVLEGLLPRPLTLTPIHPDIWLAQEAWKKSVGLDGQAKT